MGISSCLMCDKHKLENIPNLIYENEFLVVSHGPLESQILGYLYIELKRHVENWYELLDEEMRAISNILRLISKILKKELNADRVYTVTISEEVKHLHIHVIPRINGKEVKGLTLIEQATKANERVKDITTERIEELIGLLKNKLVN